MPKSFWLITWLSIRVAFALDPQKPIGQFIHTSWTEQQGAPTISELWRKLPTGICGWEQPTGCFTSMESGSRGLNRDQANSSQLSEFARCLLLATEPYGSCLRPARLAVSWQAT
jgi:hypothetical protein